MSALTSSCWGRRSPYNGECRLLHGSSSTRQPNPPLVCREFEKIRRINSCEAAAAIPLSGNNIPQ